MASGSEPLLARARAVAWPRLIPYRAREGTVWSDRRLGSGSLGTHVDGARRSEEHTSELQSRLHLVCRLLLEKKKRRPTGRSPSPRTSAPTDARSTRRTTPCPT